MSPRNEKATVAITFGEYEVITPENKLRKAVSNTPFPPGEEDPIARAEKALGDLSSNFGEWMDSECERLDVARRNVVAGGFTNTNKEALFHAAHDIKGESATFGFPLVAATAESLCRLIEHTPDSNRIPLNLVSQHVDAVRAIYREYSRSNAGALAGMLNKRLREVTDEFLIHENRDRPEVLEQIMGPSIVPE